ncbi:hypothetical protein [uncultured Methylobacterium sp.]|uniref:hypothetical protein n=1 Tax=uncultured Methylobacterium sp. TaxID=157278 RepID=UPI0035CBFF49
MAAATNQPRYLSCQGSDGRKREITVRPQSAPTQTAEAGNRICRRTDGSATIDGAGTTELPQQLVCRTSKGDWLPA